MSDFISALVDMFPEHNSLKNPNNDLRRVLDLTVGEWFDNRDVLTFYEQLFLTTATGKWLDLHGADYGVPRRIDEDDDVYRERIVQEKNDNLTPLYLRSLYGLSLYVYSSQFNVQDNSLTSDNPYIPGLKMTVASDDIRNILTKKFILDHTLLWLNDGAVDYIINTSDEELIGDYLKLYDLDDASNFFSGNTGVKSVKLTLPNVLYANSFFMGCTGLVSVELDLPNVIQVGQLLRGCTGLDSMTINMPNAVLSNIVLNSIFQQVDCSYVNLTVADTYADAVAFLCEYNMQSLTTLIVNGEEVDLS